MVLYAEVLWTGLATLWFLWPIVLALHAGRSAKRAYFSLSIAAVILIQPARGYFRFEASRVFMTDELMSFSPYDLVPYGVAYVRGFSDGYRDARSGRLILEAYGFGTFAPNAPSSMCQFPPKDLDNAASSLIT